MLTFTRNRVVPLGLSVSQTSASLVQFSCNAAAFDLRTAVQCQIQQSKIADPETADQAMIETLRTMVNDHRLRGRAVVSCLNADELFVETVRFPQLSPEEIAKAANWEASERLAIPIEEAEVRYLVAGEVRQDNVSKLEVILIACPRALIRRRIKVLESAGLTPVGLDIEPCAFLRSLQRAQGIPENVRTAYLYCGESGSTVLFAEGRRILFLKTIPIGGRHFDKTVSETLGIDLAVASQMRSDVFGSPMLNGENDVHRSIIESLRPCFESIIEEMEMCVRYHKVTFRGRALDGLVMSGSESAPWLAEYFCERVGLPCRQISPLDGVPEASSQIQHRSGRWAAALGLAMKRLV